MVLWIDIKYNYWYLNKYCLNLQKVRVHCPQQKVDGVYKLYVNLCFRCCQETSVTGSISLREPPQANSATVVFPAGSHFSWIGRDESADPQEGGDQGGRF